MMDVALAYRSWQIARIIASVVWVLCLSRSVLAQEQIVAYHSDITINADASMQVTETIRVRAEGVNIRRGIYREFPTSYRDRYGNSYNTTFDITSVTRDGRPEAWNAYRRSNGVRVDLGTDEFLAVPNEYEYAIHYRTSRQLGYFADHDELYWNVTGNGWGFAINEASATVQLPAMVAADKLALEGYTGGFGANGQDYVATVADGQGKIRTTAPLFEHSGLTLVFSFPKGIVHEPDRMERARNLLSDNRGLLLALLTLVAVVVYLGKAWSKVGRDPAPGVIFPLYEPPADMPPAVARYIESMGYDSKAFTAALINLAVQGYVHITQQGSRYVLQRRASTQALAADEKQLLETLLGSREELELNNRNHALIGGAQYAHDRIIALRCRGLYYLNNTQYLLPSLLGAGVMFGVVVAMKAVVPLAVLTFVVILIVHAFFAYLLRAPTSAGRKLMDQLEGFKMYMEVAEKDEMNLRNPPQLTPQLFERYLPFAIALGVEQHWAERFSRALAALQGSQPQSTAYYPVWYSGQFNAAHMGTFTHSISSSFTSAISSAATPPGSASGTHGGGGGGGFSGGGGGGGGGGGR